MKQNRQVLLAIAVLVAAWGVGCKGTTSGGGAGVKTDVAADIDNYHVESVAIIGMVNNTNDPDAAEMADYMRRAFYATGKYRFADPNDLKRAAIQGGVEDEYNRLVSTWMKTLKTDALVVQKILAATAYDAVMGMEVTNWSEEQIDANQEGTSDTTVGVKVSMFGADGKLLWSASDLKVEESQPYLPSFNTRSTQTGQSRTTNAGAVPEPPEIRSVAMKVAEEVAATLPRIKNKDAE